jgi:HSP20 family protein
MSLIKWNDKDFGFPSSITSWMDDMFSRDFFGKDFTGMVEKLGRMGTSVPAVNIHETPEAYSIEVAAPGMQKDAFDISLKDKMLTVSSQSKQEKEEKDEEKNFLRKEFSFNSFSRSFNLPENVDAEKVLARYEEGMLHITLPKKENQPEAAGRKIQVD